MSLEKCLQEILDEDASLTQSSLVELSDVSTAELGQFGRAWSSVSSERRVNVLERLIEMAEDNAQLDFSEVFKRALKDSDEVVQEKAISGLWEVQDRSIISPLLDILQSNGSCSVRAASAIALGKFAQLAHAGKILAKDGEVVQDALMAVLRDEGEVVEVRRRALESVSHFNLPSVQEYIHWAYNGSDLSLKCSALYAMSKTHEMVWLPAIVEELRSPNAPLRYEAACACGELGEEVVAHHLIPLLEDDDAQVQMASVNALGSIGGTLAKRALRRCLRTGDEAIKEIVREALEEMDI